MVESIENRAMRWDKALIEKSKNVKQKVKYVYESVNNRGI